MCGDGCNDCGALKTAHAGRDVNVLFFSKNDRFVMKTTTEKKTKRSYKKFVL